MGSNRFSLWVVLGAICLSGCASDPRPSYVAPEGAEDHLAKLTSGWGGYHITEVDGAKVDSGFITINFTGNSVVLAPGEHRVAIRFTGNNSVREWAFNYNFVAGHKYSFGPTGLLGGLKITDKQTDTSSTISN